MKTNRKRKKQEMLWKRRLRRQKFPQIFVHTLIPFLAAGILLCIAGTLIARDVYCEKKNLEFKAEVHNMTEALRNNYMTYMSIEASKEAAADEAEREDILKTRIAWALHTFIEGESALYNEDNTLYCSSQISVFMLKRAHASPDGKARPYQCPPEAFGEVIPVVEKYNEETGDNESLDYWFLPRDIYIKGGHFLPGKVDIIGLAEEEVLESYDLTPDDVTGYTHVETNYESAKSDFLMPLLPAADNKEHLQNLTEGKIFETIQSLDGWNDIHGIIGTLTCYHSEWIRFGDNFEKHLFAVATYDIFDGYRGFVYGSYGAVFLLVLLLSLTVAYRKYIVCQAQYQMDAYRREMMNAMAHDLKSPLTAVYGFAENLKNNVHTEKREYYAHVILENVQYMNDLIEHILELAKTEEMVIPETNEVDLEQLIRGQLKKQEPVIDEKNLQVNLSGACTISAGELQLLQIMDNLISNAVKYTRKDGSISIQITQDGIEIMNDMEGELGVPAEELWKPFVKGDNSRSSRQGTGIGLSIVKNLVEVQGYRLELHTKDNTFTARVKWK